MRGVLTSLLICSVVCGCKLDRQTNLAEIGKVKEKAGSITRFATPAPNVMTPTYACAGTGAGGLAAPTVNPGAGMNFIPNDLGLCFKGSNGTETRFVTGWHENHTSLSISYPWIDNIGFTKQTLLTGTSADIDAPLAWSYRTSCKGKLIAVIDSGVDRTHADLKANIYKNPGEIVDNGIDDDGNGFIDDIYGWNFVGYSDPTPTDNNNTMDDNSHGTFVSGIIGASGNNGFGVSGLCWESTILPVKTFDENGEGTVGDILESIDYARRMGANVLNNSYIIYLPRGSADAQSYRNLYQQVISDVMAAGSLFVAAAGNGDTIVEGGVEKFYPVNLDGGGNATDGLLDDREGLPASIALANVITVAGTTPEDKLAYFSNRGATSVHLAAPATYISSTTLQGLYDTDDGTSFAAPMVTGAATLYWAQNPGLTYTQVRDRILQQSDAFTASTADPPDLIVGRKRLNAGKIFRGN